MERVEVHIAADTITHAKSARGRRKKCGCFFTQHPGHGLSPTTESYSDAVISRDAFLANSATS